MSEGMPTREQCYEAAATALGSDHLTGWERTAVDAVLALFSQPSPGTPSAERHHPACGALDEPCHCAERGDAEPPRIEDMAPGTRVAYIVPAIEAWAGRVISDRMEPPLREGVKRWPTMKAQGYSSAIDEVIEVVQHVIDGTYDLSRIDPSTIRNITPPPTNTKDNA